MNKTYDYDAVMQFCQDTLSGSVQTLCDDLKTLRTLFEQLEEEYHGKGAESTVKKNYQILYNNIGQVTHEDPTSVSIQGSGIWGAACVTKNLVNIMYSNAKNDSEIDQNQSLYSNYYN